VGSFCEDPMKMPNSKAPDFLEDMKKDLAVLTKSIKDLFFNDDYTYIRAMNLWVG
jgi:hypothetical protein